MNITSKDPRKAGIVAALKAATGATKVTMVTALKSGGFAGRCMRHTGRGYEILGDFWLAADGTVTPLDAKRKRSDDMLRKLNPIFVGE